MFYNSSGKIFELLYSGRQIFKHRWEREARNNNNRVPKNGASGNQIIAQAVAGMWTGFRGNLKAVPLFYKNINASSILLNSKGRSKCTVPVPVSRISAVAL
jgi:hypothetical protein